MVGPSWNASTWRRRATSSVNAVIGNCGAMTRNPLAWSRSMTALQEEPSAHAPWTRTMFGLVAISRVPFSLGLGELSLNCWEFVGTTTSGLRLLVSVPRFRE